MTKRARRHWVLGFTAAGLAAAVIGAFALRTPAPIGHWNSAEGRAEFLTAYDAAMTDLPRPAEVRDVETDFGFVRVYRFDGAGGEPLVLLPGRAAASPVWADNLPSLLRIGDVYTVDLLGEPGLSVQEAPITDEADQAAWLDQVLARLPEQRFHLVGLSIGGWTAANLAIHRPQRVARVTLIDPVRTFDDIPLSTAIRAIPASAPWLPKSWRDSFNSYTAGGAPVRDVPVADMIEAGMRYYSMRLPQPALIEPDELRGLRMPVLALIAGRSVMHDPDTAVATATDVLVNGTVEVFPDASHAVNGERPREVADAIDRFVR